MLKHANIFPSLHHYFRQVAIIVEIFFHNLRQVVIHMEVLHFGEKKIIFTLPHAEKVL